MIENDWRILYYVCEKNLHLEENLNEKIVLSMVLVTILLFSLTGCGNKAKIFISVDGIKNYEMVEIPTDAVNFSHIEDGIYVTVKKNGKYEFIIKDTERNIHSC